MKLYKLDSKGKLRIVDIYADGAELVKISGLVDGLKVEHRKLRKGKNIGRSNETTPEQQALAEAESAIKLKIDEGYFKTEAEARKEVFITPMLAQNYKDRLSKIKWDNVYAQPKLDGMRCLAIVSDGVCTLVSRKGKTIDTVPHINKLIEELGISDVILDGELYIHDVSFQETMSFIKKNTENSLKVEYWIYDVIQDKPFKERNQFLLSLKPTSSKIKIVRALKFSSDSEIKDYHVDCVNDDFEGVMVRWGNFHYEMKRSQSLLKVKEFQDIALEIIDLEPFDARPDECLVICKMGDKIVRATPKMTQEQRRNLLLDKDNIIGQTAEIRFFEWTDDGMPRFPVMVGIRLDK